MSIVIERLINCLFQQTGGEMLEESCLSVATVCNGYWPRNNNCVFNVFKRPTLRRLCMTNSIVDVEMD